ncbi:MAG: hypothetical protein GEU90_18215 [Gemmatimonas sp.]|nr:hypothetical protein [Gemmatimonas sp.]
MSTIDTLLRIGAFGVGLIGVVVFLRSTLRVGILNRRPRDGLARRIGLIVRHAITFIARHKRNYSDVQDTMAWALPLFLLSLIAAWFVLVQLSFSLMIWAVEAESDLPQAFVASGSALSTLGFATPSSAAGRVLAIFEGAFGLGVIVFMFTFIPGYVSVVQMREDRVAWLYGRAGRCPTSSSLIEWCYEAGQGDDMTPIWNDSERWFIGVLETHSLTPLLALAPSVDDEKTWVGAAGVILDAASIALSTLEVKGLSSARLCHETGVNALDLVAREFAASDLDAYARAHADPGADYDAAYERLIAAGAAVRPDREACRANFLTLRSQYEGSIRRIASAALMPIDQPWVLPQEKREG